jgi:hypothetical protein
MFDAFMPHALIFCTGVLFKYSSGCRKRSLSSKFKLQLNWFKTGISKESPMNYF